MAAGTNRANTAETIWLREIDDEGAIAGLAADIAMLVGPGDLVTLSGGLGAGKTAFARALIHILTGDHALEVPSPAFTLMQSYEGPNFPIVHADFYRIEKPQELIELGFEEACEGALVLVEWPERAGDFLDASRLDVELRLDPERRPGYRAVTLTGVGSFAARLARAKAVHELLERSGWGSAERYYMQGDASTRSYERLVKPDGTSAILMISPPRPDGPPLRYGKSYSAIAKLAEDIRPFIAVGKGLRAQGLSAPEILAFDLSAGLAAIEDLGSEPITSDGAIIEERHAVALAALAHLHGVSLPDTLPIDDEETYRIPLYDVDALSIEIELLLDWYIPYIACAQLSSGVKATFINLWRQTVQTSLAARPTWTLRDYHSPNLLWLSEREGIARAGIIDFQDCVLGHPAYDVVSLLQDARVDVPQTVELKLLAQYASRRRSADPGFDMAGFARAYAILGAQRATKILGIFARLDERDHKPQYLAHLPRVERYLVKNLGHPALAELKLWYEEHLPRIFSAAS
ncbi:MAG TPA: tRNA (adenosine(37)-N6)-threonylcarbamoyltransferase complex ATPase subunit type 1 TsaE [Methylocella sp.]|nr:tRNA (adenosine(37)-N6)-threonylcarbamoyltransferase complex ATPase subunit type 1 TsaE [Methylocella sp.]